MTISKYELQRKTVTLINLSVAEQARYCNVNGL